MEELIRVIKELQATSSRLEKERIYKRIKIMILLKEYLSLHLIPILSQGYPQRS